MLFTLAAKSDTVILQDTPNPGDTTVIETITTGNPVVTNNLLSQQWNDGSWEGTMFPNSSDINENIYLTGKDGAYAESTINSQDVLTEQELQQGLTSTLTAKVRWWNTWDSTIEMRQTATNGIDTTTQSIILEDTTNHNNKFNSHTNTLIIAPDAENTHGTLTTRFTFDIDNAAGNWNGGHSGPDIIQPDLRLSYSALSSTTITDITYCYEKSPPTCPAQEEIAGIETFLDTFEETFNDLYIDDLYVYEEQSFIPETIDFEYSFNNELFEEEEFEIEDDYLALDDFFFEEQFFEDDYYQEPIMDDFIPEDIVMGENLDWNDSNVEVFDELPPMEEYFTTEEVVMEEIFEEVFEEYMEEPPMDFVEEVFMEEPQELEMAEVKEEPIEEIPNEVQEEEIKEEEIVEAKQEEKIEEEKPVEDKEVVAENKEVVEDQVEEQPEVAQEEKPEVSVDVKIAKIEKVIQDKVKNTIDQVNITLTAVNEVISREMISQQPDISSYMAMNANFFDDRQLPGGNQDFFNQMNLTGYDYNIYENNNMIVAMVGSDPVVQHEMKMQEINNRKQEAYKKLMEAINARNVQ